CASGRVLRYFDVW
nr:immunoglobulin heavy chain junction region [Mus musculus]